MPKLWGGGGGGGRDASKIDECSRDAIEKFIAGKVARRMVSIHRMRETCSLK